MTSCHADTGLAQVHRRDEWGRRMPDGSLRKDFPSRIPAHSHSVDAQNGC